MYQSEEQNWSKPSNSESWIYNRGSYFIQNKFLNVRPHFNSKMAFQATTTLIPYIKGVFNASLSFVQWISQTKALIVSFIGM